MTEHVIWLAEISVGLSVFNSLMLVTLFLGRPAAPTPDRRADDARPAEEA